MKLIVAIIQPEELPEIKEELLKKKIYKFTVSNALGQGKEIPIHEVYRGIAHEITLLKKVRVEIAVNDNFVDDAVDVVEDSLKSFFLANPFYQLVTNLRKSFNTDETYNFQIDEFILFLKSINSNLDYRKERNRTSPCLRQISFFVSCLPVHPSLCRASPETFQRGKVAKTRCRPKSTCMEVGT